MSWQSRFTVPMATMPQWAEDEPERLIYASNRSGSWQIYAWDRARGTRRQVTRQPAGARFCQITPDGQTIYWFADAIGAETGSWMMQPFEGGEDEPLDPTAPSGWRTGLATGRGGVWATGLTTLDTCLISVGGVASASYTLSRSDKPAMPASFSHDGRLLVVAHPGDGYLTRPGLRVFDVATCKVVAELSDGTEHGIIGARFSPRRDDSRIVFLHEQADLVRPGVWDPVGGARLNFELNLPGDVEIVDWHPDAEHLIIVHSHHGVDQAYLLELSNRAIHSVPHLPGTITDIGVRPDGEVWLRRTSGGVPPRVERMPSGELVLEAALGSHMVGAAYEAWQFRNASDDWVRGFIAQPSGMKPFPTVLLVHGGPHQHDADSWNPRVQAFVDNGWMVAMLNYQGSTGRGKAWLDRGVGDPGPRQVSDIVAARRALIERGMGDPDQIVLVGGSWGGYLALLTIGLAPDGWRAAVAVAPLADLLLAYREQSPHVRHLLEMLFAGTPETIPERYHQSSPITYVDAVRTPLLIVAGENDSRCPRRQVDSYVERLRHAGGKVELVTYRAGHNSLVSDVQQYQMERILEFLPRIPNRSYPLPSG